jgi:serine/threonine protein kinase
MSVNEESLFAEALEMKDPKERAAFLDRACADDPVLRKNVDSLLSAYDAGQFLEAPAATIAEPCVSEGPRTLIGPYKLLQMIGEGGMGTVFMAEQTQPVQRKVALKIIKPGMDSRQVIARFEAERQALAVMDHPNIARVFDAGATDSGRPYFVMELVKGVPLTKYCDEQRLTPRQRLELFVPVCQAIQHAHQKGIIHRDIKPSNVLVAPFDGKPVVKVIDFGIAKATGQRLTDKTLFTEFGAVVGTLEYMSPEQAELNNQDIDTRSDIYALGVLLYELLTGTTPLDKKRLKQAALLEVLRVIREEEPPTPSTRLSTTDEMPSIAANRGLEPKKLSGMVRGELDWIVMKALEKDRNRRYESANALAQDVQRYLADEPVQAGPPSTAYRLRKFLRRNRGPVLAVAIVLLALVGGIVGTTLGLVQAEEAWQEEARQRGLVEQERDDKETARADAVVKARAARLAAAAEHTAKLAAEKAAAAERLAKEMAQKRLKQIEKANDILTSVFRELDPRMTDTEDATLREQLGQRLHKAAELLEGDAVGDPVVVARMQVSLGLSQRSLGHAKQAIAQFTRARRTLEMHKGTNDAETLSCMSYLADAYQADGQLDEALPLFKQTLAMRTAKFGLRHPDTLQSTAALADAYLADGSSAQALPLFEEVLEKRKAWDPDHLDTLRSMGELARAYREAGQPEKALPLYQQALEKQTTKLPADHPDILTTMNNLAVAYQAAGKFTKSLPLLVDVLAKTKNKHANDHPDTLRSMYNLANAYVVAGRFGEGVSLYEQTLAKQQDRLGRNHPRTLGTMSALGGAYVRAGRVPDAQTLLEQTLPKQQAKLGADHPDILTTMDNLAVAYQAAGLLPKALPLFQETLKKRRVKLRVNHPSTLMSMDHLAQAYLAANQRDRALPLFEEALAKEKVVLGDNHPDTLNTMNNLGWAYREAGRFQEALALFAECLEKTAAKFGADHPDALITKNNLALTHVAAGQLNKGLPMLKETLSKMKVKPGPGHPSTLKAVLTLGVIYVQTQRFAEGEPLLAEWIAQHRPKLPADEVGFVSQLSLLGTCQVRQKKFVEAEKTLRECHAFFLKKPGPLEMRYLTENQLGVALTGQKKYADAEPFLVNSARALVANVAKLSTTELAPFAVRCVVDLYDAWGKKEEAAKWRKELAALTAKPPE